MPEWVIVVTPTTPDEVPPAAIHGYFVKIGHVYSQLDSTTALSSGNVTAQAGGVTGELTVISKAFPSKRNFTNEIGSDSQPALLNNILFSILSSWTKGDDGKYRLAYYLDTYYTASVEWMVSSRPTGIWFAKAAQHIEIKPGQVWEG